MTLRHYNECDRCGKHYNAIHPDEVICLRLPNKIVNAKPKEMFKPAFPVMVMQLSEGMNPADLLKPDNSDDTPHAFCAFCPECEISLISWFD